MALKKPTRGYLSVLNATLAYQSCLQFMDPRQTGYILITLPLLGAQIFHVWKVVRSQRQAVKVLNHGVPGAFTVYVCFRNGNAQVPFSYIKFSNQAAIP